MSEERSATEKVVRTIRTDFTKGTLLENQLDTDPARQFQAWLDEAFAGGNHYANAMTLSTVDTKGYPSSRIMLLRDLSFGGFTFFTNYRSKKANDLLQNPMASLLFFWPELERQVRIQGTISLLPAEESDRYFQSRPFESQVGAWVSTQSSPIDSRELLEKKYAMTLERYKGTVVPRPKHWGGYVLKPISYEFWQGRASRLHDRLQYVREGGEWKVERLMP